MLTPSFLSHVFLTTQLPTSDQLYTANLRLPENDRRVDVSPRYASGPGIYLNHRHP